MSFDHDRPSKWFDPGDVVHSSMMKTWLGGDNRATAESIHASEASPEPMTKASKRLFALITLLLVICATCSIVTQIVGYH